MYLSRQRTASIERDQQFQIAWNITRYYVTGRGLIFLAYGEDGDGGLDQAMQISSRVVRIYSNAAL